MKATVSVVLLPSAKDSETLIGCSSAIADATASHIRLGPKALPHITIAQFATHSDDVGGLWQEVGQYKSLVPSLISAGLAFTPEQSSADLWVELQFLTSDSIRELQDLVLGTEFARKHEKHHPAEAFRPHCTLALLDEQIVPRLGIENLNIFRRTYDDLSLAVGINGENYTLTEVKFR